MSSIEIDYRDTLKKAEQLDSLSRELRAIASRDLSDLQSGVNQAWQGSCAELYKKRVRELAQQVEAQARTFQSIAGGLRRTAERYRILESTANGIFGV